MKICDKQFCTGCTACASTCIKNAIVMETDDKGFLYPIVRLDMCVNCGACVKVCPQNQKVETSQNEIVYAALAKDDKIRAKSSSGGVFSVLAKKILAQEGVVFGAAFNEELTVSHICVSEEGQLERLRGSKYVQSEIGDSFTKAKEYLKEGKWVLFSGTPCQIAGLKSYLSKNYAKLITVDILCHGTPSPMLFKKFLECKEMQKGNKIKKVLFRCKYPGWQAYNTKVCYVDGSEEYDNSYVSTFLSERCLRDSCHHCLYASTHRVGDITLGDFWGYKESAPEHIQNDDLGISFVSLNSSKGEQLFSTIRSKLGTAKRTMEIAAAGNPILRAPSVKSSDSDKFWEDVKVMSWEALVDKYQLDSSPKKEWMSIEDRDYYAQPYIKRHMRHKIHCWKIKFMKVIKK